MGRPPKGTPKPVIALHLKGSREYKAWLEGEAYGLKLNVSEFVDMLARDWAIRNMIDPPPKRLED